MRSDWPLTRLGDLVKITHGWPFKSEQYSAELTGRPIVVSIGNFRYEGGFRFGETATKEYRAEYPREYELSPGDLLLIMTCQTAGGEILGIPAHVPDDGRTYLHNQRIGKVVLRTPGAADPAFLYWLFKTSAFNQELVISASGTKILHTSPGRIEDFRFHLPALAEQRAIASILGALDDKIELNRRMNQTLEAIARALFKSWFVDFDPVRAKMRGEKPTGLDAATAALFPERLVETEIGEVPEDWPVVRLGDMLTIDRGVSYKGEGLVDSGRPMINLGCFAGEGRFREEKVKGYNGEFKPRHVVRPGELVVANTDMTQQRVILGSPILIPQYVGECLFSHHVYGLRFNSQRQDSRLLVYYHLLEPAFREKAEGYATGTTVLFLPQDAIAESLIAVPPPQLLRAFNLQAEALRLRSETATIETAELAKTRDALLPKLLSGEVRITGEPEASA